MVYQTNTISLYLIYYLISTYEKGHKELMQVAKKIKNEGKGKNFDCIIGLSGGIDSSYFAYIVK